MVDLISHLLHLPRWSFLIDGFRAIARTVWPSMDRTCDLIARSADQQRRISRLGIFQIGNELCARRKLNDAFGSGVR